MLSLLLVSLEQAYTLSLFPAPPVQLFQNRLGSQPQARSMGPALSRPIGRRSKAYLKEADAILQRRREAAAPEDEGKMGRRALWAWGPGSALLPVVPPVPYPVPFAALSRARLRGSSVWALCCALRLTFRFRPSAAPGGSPCRAMRFASWFTWFPGLPP